MDRENELRNSKRTRVLIIAGGRSDEHDASIKSARGVFEIASRPSKLRVSILIITRQGYWLSESASHTALFAETTPTEGEGTLHEPTLSDLCDVVWPVIPDGPLQGLLEMANVPYVGCETLSMALCRAKHMTKLVLSSQGIPMVRYFEFSDQAYIDNPQGIMQQVKSLQSPWFVKPASLGSSIGVTKVKDDAGLHDAIEHAMGYDRRIIVEEGKDEIRELETGVLGNRNPTVSHVGEVIHHAEFFDYQTKYSPGTWQLQVPADIPPTLALKAQGLALQAFRLLDCAGFARIDFFLDPRNDQLYLNEVNGTPTFTTTSAFGRLMQGSGHSLVEVAEEVVKLGLEGHSWKTKAR
jgi:D-alanine-D-alanine ligase